MRTGGFLRSRRPSYAAAITVLTLFGFGLRALGLRWDDGALFQPDEANLVRAAVGLAFPDRLVPDFHAYGELSLLLPRLMAGWSADPATVSLAARLLSALAATAVIPVAAATARSLGGRTAGALAALLVACCSPLVAWAHFGTTESVLTLTVAVLFLLSVIHLGGKIDLRGFALWSGAAGGLGLAMKVSAAIFGVIPAVALVLGPRLTLAHLRWAVAGGALALAIFLATNPAVLLATGDFRRAIVWEGGIVRGSVDVFWTWQFAGAANGLFELRQLFGMLDGGIFLCALGGFVMFAWQRDDRALPALVFAGLYMAVTFGWHAKFVRYLAPLFPVLLVLAACFIAQCLERLRSDTATTLLAGAIALFVAAGVSRAIGFAEADPRHEVAAYVTAHATGRDTVLVEAREVTSGRYGTNTVGLLAVPAQDRRALEALADAVAGSDWLVINSRRHWSVLPRLRDRFPLMCGYYLALFRGEFGLAPVRRFERDPPLARLLRPGLAAEATRVVFDRPTVHVFQRRDARAPADILRAVDAAVHDCSLAAIVAARALAP